MAEERQKLDHLTTTRFFAALSVIFYHGGREIGMISLLPMLTSGPTAVNYFFVLSGFVLTLAYFRSGVEFDLRKYFIARFSRIYPVYFLAFVLTCLYYIGIMSKVKWGKILANIFLLQAWIPRYGQSFNIAAWSLSVEVFFYVIFPFLILAMKRLNANQILSISLWFWAISQIAHSILFILFMPEHLIWLHYFPPFHLNAFLLGIAGGVWYLKNAGTPGANQPAIRIILLGSLGFVTLAICLREYIPSLFRYFYLDAGLLAPFFLLIVLALSLDKSMISKRLKDSRLVLLGESSYALFILHIPVLWLLSRLWVMAGVTIDHEIKFAIHLLISFSLSIFVYNYMERPAQDWIRRNARVLPIIFLDVALISIMLYLSFLLRLGLEVTDYSRTLNFALRTGVTVYFICLLIFRFYSTTSWRSLLYAVVVGGSALAGLMYIAWQSVWVEGYPRSILLLNPLLIFASLYLSHNIFRSLSPKLPNGTRSIHQ
jgi:peptidoglycan/LPS O-acetylase OafA/YrhL